MRVVIAGSGVRAARPLMGRAREVDLGAAGAGSRWDDRVPLSRSARVGLRRKSHSTACCNERREFVALCLTPSFVALASYINDLRLFAEWCTTNNIGLLDVAPHAPGDLRWEGGCRRTDALHRRPSTLGGLYRYCYVEGILERNPPPTSVKPNVDVVWVPNRIGYRYSPGAARDSPTGPLPYGRASHSDTWGPERDLATVTLATARRAGRALVGVCQCRCWLCA